ncbi:Rne/Rng family ribonuclease [Tepidibacter formicigenes]|jgi:ribonuclease G|uniref:Ribonuclease G n=1 Tax=Tepidibacter formicigenes DSM 15518 TaxID=1123349 RepID=A0A1M6JZ26_9FIRM|nr:Rne/Rng family ribonuclease [Tepidibacter formicigenes]SHJ51946.1 ribonuclease G [Tepidibacter formicigenes DSM 15518]
MKSLIVDIGLYQSKIAYLENNKLIDLFIEDKSNKKTQNNIYRGIVKNILLGMEAGFIDIGSDKNAYLKINKGQVIKKGHEILVQVKKEAIGDKGQKLTTEISIPGRYLVLMPTRDDIAVSNKIADEEEIKRLKSIVSKIKPENVGVIIRTEALGKDEKDFERDFKELINIWDDIKKENKLGMGPKLLYKDLDMTLKVIRDIFNSDFDKVIVNNLEKFNQIKKILKNIDKSYESKVEYFEEGIDIFDYYGIKKELKRALNRKVWLKNGGYIIIDKTEALTVIDVNTGKYTGKLGLDETVFNTNCDAAKEIARQIRIRDIGGIIIVDFIDMKSSAYKKKLIKKLQEYLQEDKVKAKVLGMTNLGLVEIVRRKSKDSIDNHFKSECIYCGGGGKIKSINSILDNIEKEVIRIKKHTNLKNILFRVSSYIYNKLNENKFKDIKIISEYYDLDIKIEKDIELDVNNIKIIY